MSVPQQSTLGPIDRSKIVPIKVAWFGGQGSGKTTSAALLAAALSKEIYGGAPIYVTDTEPGWQFMKVRIFNVEGIELIQRTDPTFKAMSANLREAERIGACVWLVDTLSLIWSEWLQSYKKKLGYIPIDKWGDIREAWNQDFVTPFLNSSMCCMALGRLGDVREEVQDEQNPERTKLVKTGTRLKAGGSEDFGYEPHLLIEMAMERKTKVRQGSKLEGEGRVNHRADVLKDRTWALNGQVMRWSDKAKYEKGGYRQVWQSLKPHWDAMQATAHVQIKTGTSSQDLISSNGDSAYAERVNRVRVVLEEIAETLHVLWPGQTEKAKDLRRTFGEVIFNTRAWPAVEQKPLEELEWAWKILQHFEQHSKTNPQLLTEKDLTVEMLENLKAAPAESEEEDDFAPRREKTVVLEGQAVR